MSLKNVEKSFVQELQVLYPENEAQQIWYLAVAHLTGFDLRACEGRQFNPDPCMLKMLSDIRKRLLKAEPIQYILNEAWFYDIPFFVNKQVLIPRPETEELVDAVIQEHKTRPSVRILDIGTGSGCIPVILKRKLPDATVTSCDISAEALAVARKNAAKYQQDIHFMQLDFLEETNWPQLPQVDVLVSNPPYIPVADQTSMHKNVTDYEPALALFVPDEDPLLFYRKIAGAASAVLAPGGRIYLEVHENLAEETRQLLETKGFTAVIKTDMQGKQRFVLAGFANSEK
ncbi:peptide chain release factor N(5)-glutamine methyltransferase [Niabella drilacis]|uniref:peptide chain release factor N(5)-glutamine methyltransferase n=1 Tax=Niabella drilacis (strain DSM 25811 / CCM 8410 / CCUG 62505 / LMG 26954 / E90) TaxID=1285928 RepID=A0A1G6Y968_NIADE|nr:peptide chain release factor N(5)-glutamine methyltransferase [Niabella drilacis]SDD86791.1 release factor glutamine methyltransferase [Niabella drilacis]